MNLNAFVNTLASALATDAQLQGWSVTKYDAPVTIYKNFDARYPPSTAETPFVVLIPEERVVGHGRSTKTHRLTAWVAVHDDAYADAVIEDNIVAYAGIDELETLCNRVIRVTAAACDAFEVDLDEALTMYDTIEHFPYIEAFITFTITDPTPLGTDHLS